jgi:hypothetical protein
MFSRKNPNGSANKEVSIASYTPYTPINSCKISL